MEESSTSIMEKPIKFLKSLYLLLISIFKTLSGNYVPLFLITFIIFYLFTFLSKRKLVLPCSQCENGSWWYKCMPGTGFGTATCTKYTYISNIAEDFFGLIKKGPERYLRTILMLLQHNTNILKKSVEFFDDTTRILTLLVPHWLLFKYIVKPVTKALFSGFDKVRNELDNFSCAFTIPVVNVKLDLCKSIIEGLKALLNLIETIFELLLDLISTIVSFIFDFIKKYIFGGLIKIISVTITFITNNLFKVFMKVGELLNEIKKPFNMIFDIPIHRYFILVLDYIINIIIENVPGGSIIKTIPSLLIGIALLPIIFGILVPVIGGLVALFSLIKSLVFAILRLDDNDDFMFIFKKIYAFIIGFFSKKKS